MGRERKKEGSVRSWPNRTSGRVGLQCPGPGRGTGTTEPFFGETLSIRGVLRVYSCVVRVAAAPGGGVGHRERPAGTDSRAVYPVGDNSEFIGEFLVESTENLDQLDKDLLALEAAPGDPQRLASIFRTVHTIKGNSGFFGFSKLGALAHSGEHLLGRLRDGKLTLDDRITGTLYSMVDAVRSILRSIEETGGEGEQDYRELARQLADAAAAEAAAAVADEPAAEDLATDEEPVAAPPAAEATGSDGREPREAPAPEPVEAEVPAGDPAVVPLATASARHSAAGPPVASATGAGGGSAAGQPVVTDSTIRVDVDLLASILDLVGELVLARNELRSIETEDPAVQAVSQRINAVTNALQETAVKTRMQPVEHVFSRFPRTVRDLAKSCGKEVLFTIDGADTELDRTLIESIRDPLTHLIRNAVDHGLETPEARFAAGKPRAGKLSLRAFHESGRVTIEVTDDGAGIDVERVRAKAVERGLVTAEAAALLPAERVLQFIFEPGFSTAREVTSVSGRGVGMDVVRTNIEAIGGLVDLHSQRGVGTTVRVHVPLTLAIMPALVVHCAGERFAIPQAAVSELVPVRRGGESLVEGLADAPVMRVRGRLVPLVFLDAWLGLRPETACRREGTVVLVRADDREYGIVVDARTRAGGSTTGCRELLESASLSTIVIKPIGSVLGGLGIYSGATVLGDGGVVLILDLRGLAKAVELPPIEREERAVSAGAAAAADRYLVCRTRRGRRIALPLGGVVRLEKHAGRDVQATGPRRVIRRGDGFTPLADADSLLAEAALAGSPPEDSETALNVVVVRATSGDLGIAVERILDVVAAESALQSSLSAVGVLGTVALGGLATEVLDLAVASSLP
jgi:two-component system chemotaxis sensor kinase CheA